jgi:hypothetical protein
MYRSLAMKASAFVLATALAGGCAHPGFTGTSSAETFASCNPTEPCGSGRGDSDVTTTIVLGTAAVGALAVALHRYVIAGT